MYLVILDEYLCMMATNVVPIPNTRFTGHVVIFAGFVRSQ